MADCQGKEMWPEGPPCGGTVRTVLMEKKSVRMMSRILEAVSLCRAHRVHAEARGVTLLEIEKVA